MDTKKDDELISGEAHPGNGTKQWLLPEIWEESRDFFKDVLGDALKTALVVVVLVAIHWLLKHSGLNDEVIKVIDKIHTYLLFVVLGIMGVFYSNQDAAEVY